MKKRSFLPTCMQNPRLRTVYRQRKRSLPAPVRKIMALGCKVFYESVKCFTQVLSEVDLRCIFNVCWRWANSGFACNCKEKYGSIHEATRAIRSLLVWNVRRFGLLYRTILFPRCQRARLGSSSIIMIILWL